MNTSVVYPPKASKAIGYLKSNVNDIEIFVEDTSSSNTWVALLRKVLPDGVRLSSVNILGGRDNVLAACKGDQQDDGRRKLYIIDADLDILKGIRKPKLRHLYRLRAYCLENYLISEVTLVSVATLYDLNVTEHDAALKLGYSNWVLRNSKQLERLFVSYAVASGLGSSVKTVKEFIGQYCVGEVVSNDLCPRLVGKRVIWLYRVLRSIHSSEQVRKSFDRANKNAQSSNVMRFVSGKDGLLPMLYALLKFEFGVNCNYKIFVSLMARSCPDNFDGYLKTRLLRICNA